MRIFIGIPFSEENKRNLQRIQNKVVEKSEGGRFSNPKNFHMTLKFIGEIDAEKLPEIKEALEKIADKNPSFDLRLQGFDTFRKGKTCIPWMGIKEGQEYLAELQEQVETAFEKIGYKKESRPFLPHMTFGRKVQLSFSNESFLRETLKHESVRIKVASIAILESTRISGELVYPVIKRFFL